MITKDRDQSRFNVIPVLGHRTDPEGRILEVTDELAERLGYPPEHFLGLRPEELATDASARRIREEHLPRFRRTGCLENVPVAFRDQAGGRVSLLATTTAVRNERGDLQECLTVYTELSDRARLERQYRDLYQSTPAMLHTIDANGQVTAVSEYWLEKLGYAREEVIGRPITDFLTDESRQSAMQWSVDDVIAAGEQKNVPRQMVTKSGEILDVLMSTRAERNVPDGHQSLRVASKDMTERNRAEAELREAYEEIARLNDELEQERDYLREEVSVAMNFGKIVGESPALKAMLARIGAVADTPASVLIIGETGTGKELVAHAIHARSGRADGPLVKVNCASIPDELFESEFFGHVRGAFTGAHRDRVGRFQLADGGTIFLDEVGEIPLPLQGKLLRVLQEKQFERVGEEDSSSVDVRVIAATNKDLEKAVEAGEFREDLYYRLSVFPVHVPPLRRRGDDVVMLAVHFLEQVCLEFGRPVPVLTQGQVEAMRQYEWPGNVRELKNVIERAVILSPGETLRLDLPNLPPQTGSAVQPHQPGDGTRAYLTEDEMKAEQRRNLLAVLTAANWRISGDGGAAELLGVKPSTLSDRMRAMGLRRPQKASTGRK
ncbi:MAG: sigma 54-interacting transcriptional regulator [Gammaproteobacteria bacterium]|nr:sigma 54-interacting transcriptional regulator [Gammaproteobacteria bacterium]